MFADLERRISKNPGRNTRGQTHGERIGEGRAPRSLCPLIASSRPIGKARVAYCIISIKERGRESAEEDDDDDRDLEQKRRLLSRR